MFCLLKILIKTRERDILNFQRLKDLLYGVESESKELKSTNDNCTHDYMPIQIIVDVKHDGLSYIPIIRTSCLSVLLLFRANE